MILDIYSLLFVTAIVLLVLGYWREKPVLTLVAFAFLFICGTILTGLSFPGFTNTGIEYKTGMTVATAGTTQTITYVFTTYTNKALGFLIMILSFFLLAHMFFDPKVKFL